MECFAFGGATVRFASLETSFHAANHTIPPPPSYEGYPLCPKDKNLSLFHGEKPLMIKWFTGRRLCQISQTILHGRDAILRVRVKWLTFNMIPQLWADVKYHVPTGFGFSPKASGFFCFSPPVFFHWFHHHPTPQRLTKTDSHTRIIARNLYRKSASCRNCSFSWTVKTLGENKHSWMLHS